MPTNRLRPRGKIRAQRIARRGELRLRGIVPNRVTMVYRVDVDAIPLPVWARERSMEGLSKSQRHVWLTRMDAKELAQQDRDAGGQGLLTPTEYRRCPVCDRLLLGADAAERRRLNESCRTGTQLPCGPGCLEKHWRDRKKAA